MQTEEKLEVKVELYTNDGQMHWGYVYLAENQRLQDMMNDARKFIPVNILRNSGPKQSSVDYYDSTVIHKDFIAKIREL